MSRQHGSDDSASPDDEELPSLPPEWADFAIPDDLRELADEAEQVRAELARANRRRRPSVGHRRDGFLARHWVKAGVSGPLVALILFVVAAVGSLMVVVLPKPQRMPRRVPLATTAITAGRTGGLLPKVLLAGQAHTRIPVRDLRPAVLVLSPAVCVSCQTVRNQVLRAAGGTQLTVGWITEGNRAATSANTQTVSLPDPDSALRTHIDGASAAGPTVVLVQADGRIHRIIPDPLAVPPSRAELAALSVN